MKLFRCLFILCTSACVAMAFSLRVFSTNSAGQIRRFNRGNLLLKDPAVTKIPTTSLFMGESETERKWAISDIDQPRLASIALYLLNTLIYFSSEISSLRFDHQAIARGQIYRLFTSCFLHSTRFTLTLDIGSLYLLGPFAERVFGEGMFFTLYAAGGILANIGTFIFGCSSVSEGACGCTFGLLGALVIYYCRNKKVLGWSAGLVRDYIQYLLMFHFYAYNCRPKLYPNSYTHIGGFLVGSLLSFLFGPRLFLKTTSPLYGQPDLVDRPLINCKRLWNEWITGNKIRDDDNKISTVAIPEVL